jgi:hypothetical protein
MLMAAGKTRTPLYAVTAFLSGLAVELPVSLAGWLVPLAWLALAARLWTPPAGAPPPPAGVSEVLMPK